jgi:hypothetical protein
MVAKKPRLHPSRRKRCGLGAIEQILKQNEADATEVKGVTLCFLRSLLFKNFALFAATDCN